MADVPKQESNQPGKLFSLTSTFAVHLKGCLGRLHADMTVKSLMRLDGYPGWSESSLDEWVITLVLLYNDILSNYTTIF